MKLMKLTFLAFVFNVVVIGSVFATPDIAVIANKDIGIDSATKEQLMKLWLRKSKTLSGARGIIVADQTKDKATRSEFYEKVISKTPRQVKAYWAKIIFTGKGYPPREFSSDAAVLEWVASTPGAVGYVSKSVITNSVKVLFVID